MRGHVLVQRQAVHIFHGQVGRAVFLKIAVDADDPSVSDKGRKGLGLFQKLFLAESEVLRLIGGVHLYGDARPARELSGEVLLDRHALARLVIQRNVGDAEAALSQHMAEDVASVEDGTRFQGQRVFTRRRRRVKAAEGAHAVRIHFAKAMRTLHAAGLLSHFIFTVSIIRLYFASHKSYFSLFGMFPTVESTSPSISVLLRRLHSV